MSAPHSPAHAYVEVVFPNRPTQVVSIDELHFLIGRGKESGNHLALDEFHVSRKCAAILASPRGLRIEDRGQLNGIFVNGQPTTERDLCDGDRITLGSNEGCQLVFRLNIETQSQKEAMTKLRSLIG